MVNKLIKIMAGNILILLLLVLAGCQLSAPAESVIRKEISQMAGGYIEEEIEITRVEIEKRFTDENYDTAYCSVIAEGEIATYNMYFTVEHKYYDKGGWILENINIDQQDEWTALYNKANLKTVDDINREKDKIYIRGVDANEMTFSWEPQDVYSEDGKYVQHFLGSAVYSNEICNIDVPIMMSYTFETQWIGDVFCANWKSAFRQRAETSDCMELDMSGVWVGNTKPENLWNSLNQYIDRGKYTGEMKVTLKVDKNGYPYGKMETIVPYIDIHLYTSNKNFADKSIDLGCNELKYSGTNSYDNWYTDFELIGMGNEDLHEYGSGNDIVGLYSLRLDPINKTLTGNYFRTYGTSFDVELKWLGKK